MLAVKDSSISLEQSELLDWVRIERQFLQDLKSVDLDIIQVATDGNCLFHSIVIQIYGGFESHAMIRQKCMDYILLAKDFFKNFVEE